MALLAQPIELVEHEPDDAAETRRGLREGRGIDRTPLRPPRDLEEHPQGVREREDRQR